MSEPKEWLFDRQLHEQLEFLGKENGIITRQLQARSYSCWLASLLRSARLLKCAGNVLSTGARASRMLHMQDHFIFKIEGTGALPCKHIVLTALDILMKKMRALNEAVPAS